MTIPANALAQLAAFQARSKFIPADAQPGTLALGLSNPALQGPLNQLLNQAADDFAVVVRQPAPTEGAFQQQIDHALARF